MASKVYAVKIGKVPGIYYSWAECKAMVDGYPGAVYKSFPTVAEADAFIRGTGETGIGEKTKCGIAGDKTQGTVRKSTAQQENLLPAVYAFVDGSYNVVERKYGYGGFLVHDGIKEVLQGAGNDSEMASMRNVAGEVLGSKAAIEKALELGLGELTIYYDYLGIEMWANGGWKRNKQGTIAYFEYVQSVKNRIKLHFVKVKGHSGVEGNEEADRLAKEAVGILPAQ